MKQVHIVLKQLYREIRIKNNKEHAPQQDIYKKHYRINKEQKPKVIYLQEFIFLVRETNEILKIFQDY